MVALWKRLREYIGQTWVREYGDVNDGAFQSWLPALLEFSEEQIAQGVKACWNWTKDFPPTIGQFRQLCMTVSNQPNFTERRIAEEKSTGQPSSMIEHLSRSATTPTAKRELERMRRILAGQDVETKDESMRILGLHRRWGA